MGRNWMSIVVSETSSSLRGTSMGPVTETRTFVWPGLAVMEKVPDVQRADPSARESGFVVMPFDRYIFCCYLLVRSYEQSSLCWDVMGDELV
jgi:hypothetical protein